MSGQLFVEHMLSADLSLTFQAADVATNVVGGLDNEWPRSGGSSSIARGDHDREIKSI